MPSFALTAPSSSSCAKPGFRVKLESRPELGSSALGDPALIAMIE